MIYAYHMTGVIFRLLTQSTFQANFTEPMNGGKIISGINGNDK